jgi:hypothetical protein
MQWSRWGAALLVALAGCEGKTTGPRAPHERAAGEAVQEPVAARVNGEPIHVSEVAALVSASGLSARDALARLVDERLLSQHAESQGYGRLRSVEMEVARARVRALLVEAVEREIRPEGIPAERVRERFEALKAQPGGSGLQLQVEEPKIRTQLAVEARQERLQSLIDQLKKQTKIVYDEPAITKAFASEGAEGTGT